MTATGYSIGAAKVPVAASRRMSKAVLTYVAFLLVFGVSAVLAVVWRHEVTYGRHHHGVFVGDMAYVDLPQIATAMGGAEDGPRLRANIALEIARSDLDLVEDFEPRIVDRVNSYLAGLDPEQLRQPSAMPVIRQELLRRINTVGMPAPVHDLMFRQLIVM